MTQDIRGQKHSGKDGTPQAKPQMRRGSAVPPLPHMSSHQPKRYKATGTARVYGAPAPSARSHQKDTAASKPAKLHMPLPVGGSKAHGIVSLKKSKFTVSSGGHTDRSHIPLIVLCILVLLIGAGVGWTCFLRPVHITVNGQAKQVRIGTSLDKYLVDTVASFVSWLGQKAQRIEGGNFRVYIVYIVAALVFFLVLAVLVK